jgi:hypothetical protein
MNIKAAVDEMMSGTTTGFIPVGKDAEIRRVGMTTNFEVGSSGPGSEPDTHIILGLDDLVPMSKILAALHAELTRPTESESEEGAQKNTDRSNKK